MANTSVIEIFDPGTGDVKKWERFSARHARFLAQFPIKDGWRVQRECRSAVASTPELVSLYQTALANGINPREAGLPGMPTGQIFTARLINPEGIEVASGSASSLAPMQSGSKDYECAETAAYQRLLQAVGLGGELFDDDEARNIEGMGGRVREMQSKEPHAGTSDAGRLKLVAGTSPEKSDAGSRQQQASRTTSAGPLPDVLTPEQALAGIVGSMGQTEMAPAVAALVDDEAVASVPTSESSVETVVSEKNVVALPAPTKASRKKGMPNEAAMVKGMQRLIETLAKSAGVQARPVSTMEEAEEEQKRLVELAAARG